ncbi:adenylate kinase [Desulfolutivibrio sulfoxidireducens]|nr:adenylate kinase [Desulfolutivibrio sulfoxidireducens]
MPTAYPAQLGDLSPAQARLGLDVAAFTREVAPDLGGAAILVGVSGGPDSTALVLLLRCLSRRLGITLAAAHLDHGLRPESADEARAARDLCRALGIACHTERADLPRPGSKGLEAAAREARYAFFERVRTRTGADFLAVGHTLNDLAEDIVLRLLRGCGWPALGGMPAFDARRHLLRPLLLTPRTRLLKFLAELGVRPAEDRTNADPAFRRNRVRHRVLPLFLEENPGFLEATARLWRQAVIDRDYFTSDPVLENSPKRTPEGDILIPKEVLSGLHPARRIRLFKSVLDGMGPGESLTPTLFGLERAFVSRRGGTRLQFPGGKTARIFASGVRFQHTGALTVVGCGDTHGDCEIFNKEASPVNILTFGPNGSGKGTQGSLVKKKYNLAHIESGAIFREHIGGGTELGMKAKAYIDKGELVPDDITIPMILSTLKEKGKDGWLLDGFPRNIVQAQKLWEALQAAGMKIDYVIEILLPRQIAKNRIMGRRLCANDPNHPNNIFIDAIKPNGDVCRVCGGALKSRSDDQDEEAINKRHDIYYDTTTGTLAAAYFYKDLAAKGATKYIELNGEGSIDSIKETLLAQLA